MDVCVMEDKKDEEVALERNRFKRDKSKPEWIYACTGCNRGSIQFHWKKTWTHYMFGCLLAEEMRENGLEVMMDPNCTVCHFSDNEAEVDDHLAYGCLSAARRRGAWYALGRPMIRTNNPPIIFDENGEILDPSRFTTDDLEAIWEILRKDE